MKNMRASSLQAALVGLAISNTAVAAPVNSTINETAIAANLEHFWSYGRSPAVYPTPPGSGKGSWADAYTYATALVAKMTNDEKNNLTYGLAKISLRHSFVRVLIHA
jgi:hypothetical protein